jgi:hypothetical protein
MQAFIHQQHHQNIIFTMKVGMLFAFWRLVHPGLSTIRTLSRLDQCIIIVGSKIDRGYASCLAIVLMVHVLDFKAAEEQQAQLVQGGTALPAKAVPPPPANALLPGANSAAVEAAASIVAAAVISSSAANMVAGSRALPPVALPRPGTSAAEWEQLPSFRGGMPLPQTQKAFREEYGWGGNHTIVWLPHAPGQACKPTLVHVHITKKRLTGTDVGLALNKRIATRRKANQEKLYPTLIPKSPQTLCICVVHPRECTAA